MTGQPDLSSRHRLLSRFTTVLLVPVRQLWPLEPVGHGQLIDADMQALVGGLVVQHVGTVRTGLCGPVGRRGVRAGVKHDAVGHGQALAVADVPEPEVGALTSLTR